MTNRKFRGLTKSAFFDFDGVVHETIPVYEAHMLYIANCSREEDIYLDRFVDGARPVTCIFCIAQRRR